MAIERGQELGAFQLGSTVVLVFPEKAMRFEPMEIGDRLRFGQRIGAGQRGDKTGWMAR
jgi:phosphatidylserine decarboxylase